MLHYLWFGLRNGWGNLNKYQSSGPYKVGTKLIRSDTLGNEILVYYPMDQEDYDEMIGDNNMPYNLHYDLNELKKANYAAFGVSWLMATQWHINTNTVENGPLASEFSSGSKSIIPIVFSHGYLTVKMMYTVICSELASYGYIVFSMGHQDGS